MKKIKSLLLVTVMMAFVFAGTIAVSAGSTDLSSMTIYAVDGAGNKTEVPINFSSTIYSYDITVRSTAEKLEIDYTPEDDTSTAEIVNELYNTKMDTGAGNKTQVKVTAADGSSALYTINTTKLTPEEDEGYTEPDAEPGEPAESEETVKVGKRTLNVSKTIKGDVPKGFEKSTYKYKGKKYECIVKGDASQLVALYLHNDKVEGFFVYNEAEDSFYELKNIQIASRMYTIVNVDEPASILKNYSKKTIDMGNESVKVWALDEDEDFYLVYAMNWDEEVNLYCYDAKENDFQRYPISEDTYSQKEAAEVAYTNLQTNRNNLARNYNRLLKIIGGLLILIVILIFIIINMKLSKKSKNLEYDDQYDEELEDDEEEMLSDRELAKAEKKAEKLRKKEEKKLKKQKEPEDELLEDEELAELPEVGEETVEEQELVEEIPAEVEIPTEEPEDIPAEKEMSTEEPEDVSVEKEVSTKEPEVIEETPMEKNALTPEEIEEEIEENSATIQKETEEDLRETLKAMLPQDEDEDDDDEDDFEFINLD